MADKPNPMPAAVRDLLVAIGEDPERDGLKKTPQRVDASLRTLTRGYGMSVKDVIGDALVEESHQSMILVRDIELYSLCEHHMLPFFGRAHVAYIPNGKIVGLSKLPRIVEVFAHREEELPHRGGHRVRLIGHRSPPSSAASHTAGRAA